MNDTKPTVRFEARLQRPASPKGAAWTFVVLPRAASAKLPTRAMTPVEGALNGAAFLEMLSPDGQGSHWLKVSRKLRQAAGAEAGDTVTFELRPSDRVPEPTVPADLRRALADDPEAKSVWKDLTPKARADWIAWITTAKKAETRAKRIAGACDMLGTGKRRVCCFDRSGIYGGGFSAPEAME